MTVGSRLCYLRSASLEASMEDMGVTSIRLPEALLERLDKWRAGRLDDEGRQMTRSAAMRHIVMRALDRDKGGRGHRELGRP